jgi:hypothetical protein
MMGKYSISLMAIFLIIVASGCATLFEDGSDNGPDDGSQVAVVPGAEFVGVVEYLPPEQRAQLKEIDMVRCEVSAAFKSRETNVETCKDHLRNEAKLMGGNFVVLDHNSQWQTEPQSRAMGNHVQLKGIVYGPASVTR